MIIEKLNEYIRFIIKTLYYYATFKIYMSWEIKSKLYTIIANVIPHRRQDYYGKTTTEIYINLQKHKT